MCTKKVGSITVMCASLLGIFLSLFTILLRNGHPEMETRYDLTIMAEAIIEMHNRGADVSKHMTILGFISEAEKDKILFRTSESRFSRDAWRHPFHWIIQKEEHKLVVIIRSNGRNVIPENGEGDDIAVIVTLPMRSPGSFRLTPP